jgi:hypothetical protein
MLGIFYVFTINSLTNTYALDLLFLIYINGKKLEQRLIFLLKITAKYYYSLNLEEQEALLIIEQGLLLKIIHQEKILQVLDYFRSR